MQSNQTQKDQLRNIQKHVWKVSFQATEGHVLNISQQKSMANAIYNPQNNQRTKIFEREYK